MTVIRFGTILALPGIVHGVCFVCVFGMVSKGVPRHPQSLPKATQRPPKRLPRVTQRVRKLTQRTQGTPTCSQKVPQDLPNSTQMSPKGFHKIPKTDLWEDFGVTLWAGDLFVAKIGSPKNSFVEELFCGGILRESILPK